jgi:hypothetical protein
MIATKIRKQNSPPMLPPEPPEPECDELCDENPPPLLWLLL